MIPADLKDFKLYPKGADNNVFLTAADFTGFKFNDPKYSQNTEWVNPKMESSEWNGKFEVTIEITAQSNIVNIYVKPTN